jgi:sigma-B regulation protein RsbU (phosphoserine phosphatase)
MKSKSIKRSFRKYLEISDESELKGLLESIKDLITSSKSEENHEKILYFSENFLDFVKYIDDSMESLDRVIEIRENSLKVNSKELTTLNKSLSTQNDKEKKALEKLRETVKVLAEHDQNKKGEESQKQSLEELVVLISKLVDSHVEAADQLKMLFEEGIKIASATNYYSLSQQVTQTITHILGGACVTKMFYSGTLFENLDGDSFFMCNSENECILDAELTPSGKDGKAHYINLLSSHGHGLLAIIKIKFESKKESIKNKLDLLNALEPNIISSLENVRLMIEELEKAHMKNELKTARLVQSTLLPKESTFKKTGLELAGQFESATECGGDWWNYYPYSKTVHSIFLGDVTGHGTGSAIVTAVVKGYCDSFLKNRRTDLVSMFEELNQLVFDVSHLGTRLMTMVGLIIDTEKKKIKFVNAGHPQPIIMSTSDNKILNHFISLPSNLLGRTENETFVEKEFDYVPGCRILIYSDGLTECVDKHKNMYSERQLLRLIKNLDHNLSAHQALDVLNEDIIKFRKEADLADDITFAMLKV